MALQEKGDLGVWDAHVQYVMSRPGKVLTDEQRRSYFERGYVVLPKFVTGKWLEEYIDRRR